MAKEELRDIKGYEGLYEIRNDILFNFTLFVAPSEQGGAFFMFP